jgi:hypothetical protein
MTFAPMESASHKEMRRTDSEQQDDDLVYSLPFLPSLPTHNRKISRCSHFKEQFTPTHSDALAMSEQYFFV